MLYQTLTGNASTLGSMVAAGGSITVTPSEIPQMVQGALVNNYAVTATIDVNGHFSIVLLQNAKIRMIAKDSSGTTFFDGNLHLTDSAALDISAYLEATPPFVLQNTYTNAAISAQNAAISADAAAASATTASNAAISATASQSAAAISEANALASANSLAGTLFNIDTEGNLTPRGTITTYVDTAFTLDGNGDITTI